MKLAESSGWSCLDPVQECGQVDVRVRHRPEARAERSQVIEGSQ